MQNVRVQSLLCSGVKLLLPSHSLPLGPLGSTSSSPGKWRETEIAASFIDLLSLYLWQHLLGIRDKYASAPPPAMYPQSTHNINVFHLWMILILAWKYNHSCLGVIITSCMLAKPTIKFLTYIFSCTSTHQSREVGSHHLCGRIEETRHLNPGSLAPRIYVLDCISKYWLPVKLSMHIECTGNWGTECRHIILLTLW